MATMRQIGPVMHPLAAASPGGLNVSNADDCLHERVRLFLAGSNHAGLRLLDLEVFGNTVVLRGKVGTFFEKQLAVQFSRRVTGVGHVIDEIEVQSAAG